MSSSLSISLSSSSASSPSLSRPFSAGDFSPPPSPTAVSASASTARDRLNLLLASTTFLGPTTARQRTRLDRSSLVQRNLEIQAQLLLIDEQLEELPSQSDATDGAEGAADVAARLQQLYAESDTLVEESDEVETVLYEKWRLKSGGRMWLVDEMREAAVVGERLAKGTRGKLGGQKVAAREASEGERKEEVEEMKEEMKEEVKEEVKEDGQEESKSGDVEEVVIIDDSNDAEMQQADHTTDAAPTSRRSTPASRRGRGRSRRRLTAPLSQRKRQSKSDAAMLARLNAQADENERRRQERAEVNKGSLLGQLYQYFDREIDVDRVAPHREAEDDEDEQEEGADQSSKVSELTDAIGKVGLTSMQPCLISEALPDLRSMVCSAAHAGAPADCWTCSDHCCAVQVDVKESAGAADAAQLADTPLPESAATNGKA